MNVISICIFKLLKKFMYIIVIDLIKAPMRYQNIFHNAQSIYVYIKFSYDKCSNISMSHCKSLNRIRFNNCTMYHDVYSAYRFNVLR